VSGLIIIVGIFFSFIWHWWAFLIGIAVGSAVYRSNRQSVVDCAREALSNNPNAHQYFSSLGLVWEANAKSVVPDSGMMTAIWMILLLKIKLFKQHRIK
jgi:hypothetical protein